MPLWKRAACQQKIKNDWLAKVKLERPFIQLNISGIEFESVTTIQKLK